MTGAVDRGAPLIAVIGQSTCDGETGRLAEEVGRLIAEAGAVLICGGMGGVMEAACKGAWEAGGLTIGILPGETRQSANRYVALPIVTGLRDARNVIIARTCQAAIAISGKYGTLSEIAYCLAHGKPVVSLRSWEIDPRITAADTAQDVVRIALECASV